VIRAVLLLAAGCAQDTGPHLSSATPSAASHGATVTIAGERMCAGDCAHAAGEFIAGAGADLPAVQLPVVSFADTSAQVTIPAGAPTGHVSIVLTVNDTSSNALGLDVLP
jgi:hypothetical protein